MRDQSIVAHQAVDYWDMGGILSTGAGAPKRNALFAHAKAAVDEAGSRPTGRRRPSRACRRCGCRGRVGQPERAPFDERQARKEVAVLRRRHAEKAAAMERSVDILAQHVQGPRYQWLILVYDERTLVTPQGDGLTPNQLLAAAASLAQQIRRSLRTSPVRPAAANASAWRPIGPMLPLASTDLCPDTPDLGDTAAVRIRTVGGRRRVLTVEPASFGF